MAKRIIISLAVLAFFVAMASGGIITSAVDLTVSEDPNVNLNGLAARAVFTWDSAFPSQLKIDLVNTSTGAPSWFSNSDQLLTSISFDLGQPDSAGPQIVGGSVAIGAGGRSINFSGVNPQLGPGADVTGEWGYGNGGGSGLMANLVSTMAAHTTAFGGANLDGPSNLDGPRGGIATATPLIALGGLGAVADSVSITLILDLPLADLLFLAKGVKAEFGSDAAFAVPEPATLTLLVAGLPIFLRRRR